MLTYFLFKKYILNPIKNKINRNIMCNWNYDYFKSNDSAKNILNKVDWFQKENILYIFLKIDAKETCISIILSIRDINQFTWTLLFYHC